MQQERRLQIGIDFSKGKADICVLGPQGEVIEKHHRYANSCSGYEQFKLQVLETMEAYAFEGLNISGEATGYYWLPFFQEIARDEKLNEYDVKEYLLNPRWVKWFKKSFPLDNKDDKNDARYITERTRVSPPLYVWQMDQNWLPLRFYTRLRFHLIQALTREKNYFQAHLFLINSAYSQINPFSDLFGYTSSKVLTQENWDEIEKMDQEHLAEYLSELSNHALSNPDRNAHLLKQVAVERFQPGETLRFAVQRLLNLEMYNIRFLQAQIKEVNAWIAEEAKNHPQIASLSTVPGVGPVYSSGIAAEIGDLERFFSVDKWGQSRKRDLRDVDAAVAKIAGLWWPTNSSGNFEADDRHMAKCGNRYLRYYLIEAADKLRQFIPAYMDYYHKKFLEVNKFQHKRALVLTARKSIRLYVGLLHRNEPYCPKEA
jgi:transposase